MKILIVGPEAALEECKLKFGTTHEYHHCTTHEGIGGLAGQSDVIFDFAIADRPDQINIYPAGSNVFLNTVYTTLAEVLSGRTGGEAWFFGFNGMPSFVNRTSLEICLAAPAHKVELEKICQQLTTDFEIVEDRIGLVTSRVICMIINEAYLTHEEGIATREDIDKAMKLGTNYPYGPFEWTKRIGVRQVYRLLSSLNKAFGGDRYQISNLLKNESL